MAHPLHHLLTMKLDGKRWQRLTPDTIAELPEAGAVFEVANLVRSVQYIGAADGNLRQRLAAWADDQTGLGPSPGGYYVRYEAVPTAERTAEQKALAARLSSYQTTHHGRLPTHNRGSASPVRSASRNAA